jgi:glucose/arabinose dehydrogenase
MSRFVILFAAVALLIGPSSLAQRQGGAPLPPGQTNDPFSQPINATEGVIAVNFREFASLPDMDEAIGRGGPVGPVASRMQLLTAEPGGRRLFVNDMRGPLYVVSADGRTVGLYLNINDPQWGVAVNHQGRERGFQSFAFHPQFNQAGARGFGKFYTFTDSSNQTPAPDFRAPLETTTNDNVLFEWTAKTPGAATYDGDAPRELIRYRDPYANHNGGHIAFNPYAAPGSAEFGLLYVGVADGGSGGDPLKMSQNLGSGFGKILRIDPLGNNSTNKKYGIPAGNPFVNTTGALPEIYAYGVRNPQRLAWDSRTPRMFMSDIGQNIIEKVSLVPAGGNLGWNDWEGSYKFVANNAVSTENPRSDPKVTYPFAEWGQPDPLLQSQSAAVGVIVYRGSELPKLANLVIFADMPSGEIFYVNADRLPGGGQDPIRRILLNDLSGGGAQKTVLQVIQAKNAAQGKTPATRADLRFGEGPNQQIFLLNKGDGTIRVLTP